MNRWLPVMLPCLVLFPVSAFGQEKPPSDQVQSLKEELDKLRAEVELLKTNLALVESERDALRQRLTRLDREAAKSEQDLFQVGTTWAGSRFLTGPKGQPRDKDGQNWTLVITERDGERFKGQIKFVSRDDRTQSLEVTGSAPSKTHGRVVFKTVAIGALQQSFEGVLKGGQVSLNWEGSGVAGRRLVGTANLTR